MSDSFLEWIQKIAGENGTSENAILAMWKKYSQECDMWGQSALTVEFMDQNKLRGEDILEYT